VPDSSLLKKNGGNRRRREGAIPTLLLSVIWENFRFGGKPRRLECRGEKEVVLEGHSDPFQWGAALFGYRPIGANYGSYRHRIAERSRAGTPEHVSFRGNDWKLLTGAKLP
jgi:hypothetical protein